MSSRRNGFSEDITNWLRGLCMGAADIVPGVSGGTIALILGHYERLVTAISHIDRHLIRLARARKIGEALQYMDFRFLMGLGIGMVSGMVALASLMHHLLEHQRAYTYAVFFGLILGSSYLVARRLRQWNPSSVLSAIVGAVFAWQICRLQPMHGELTPMTAFLSACVAICAMILPGISGAFVLLLLGIYHPITELLKGMPRGEVSGEGIVIVATFILGCLVGLLAFSRLLKWLLKHKHDGTMAFLVGLMLGALYKVWPFQVVTADTVELPFKEQRFDPVWPAASQASWVGVLILGVLALLATIGLEWVGAKLSSSNVSRADTERG